MIVVEASVAIKWFVTEEPLGNEAAQGLAETGRDPTPYGAPELFMNELPAVLCRLPGGQSPQVREALALVEALGMARVGNGHGLLALAADFAGQRALPGGDAVRAALAALSDGVWRTADARAAGRIRRSSLVRMLGS